MPPLIHDAAGEFLRQLAGTANAVRGQASQQQQDYATNTGQVALRTGVLYQYPPAAGSPANYTSGYGLEVLSAGSGSAPSVRGGALSWTSPAQGTVTVVGLVHFDANGLLRAVFGTVTASNGTVIAQGAPVFDTSGNLVGYVPYFSGGSFAGIINF